jgi:hypothetical protein
MSEFNQQARIDCQKLLCDPLMWSAPCQHTRFALCERSALMMPWSARPGTAGHTVLALNGSKQMRVQSVVELQPVASDLRVQFLHKYHVLLMVIIFLERYS